MEAVTGYLIRYHRLRQNLSQEGLCKGICVVSYLSKIEQGKVDADPQIIHALFERLREPYFDDPIFLKRYQQIFYTYFENCFLGFDKKASRNQIQEHREELIKSPWFLCAHLFDVYEASENEEQLKKELKQLSVFEACMSDTQLFLYHLAYGYLSYNDKQMHHLKKVMTLQPCSIPSLFMGNCCFTHGSYSEALEHFQKALLLANEEGMFHVSANAMLMIGNCYSNLGVESLMLSYDKKAMYAARAIKDEELLKNVYYNLGATYQSWRRNEEAIPYLEKAINPNDPYDYYMICHKLALAYQELGRTKEGRQYVTKMKEAYREDFAQGAWLLYELVSLRYEKDPLSDPRYQQVLEAICLKQHPFIHHGIIMYHAQYLIEVYVHQRRYKDAMKLMQVCNQKMVSSEMIKMQA